MKPNTMARPSFCSFDYFHFAGARLQEAYSDGISVPSRRLWDRITPIPYSEGSQESMRGLFLSKLIRNCGEHSAFFTS